MQRQQAPDWAEPAQQQPTTDLQQLRMLVAQARDAERDLKRYEEQAADAKKRLNKLKFETLPEFFEQSGVPSITVAAEGNNPAFTAKLQPYYRANVAADWPEDRRKRAFDWLDEHGFGALVKTVVVVAFDKTDRDRALEFVNTVTAMGYNAGVKEDVHWQTLTSWLRDQHEAGGEIPPLETIGGTIGKIVNIKEEK